MSTCILPKHKVIIQTCQKRSGMAAVAAPKIYMKRKKEEKKGKKEIREEKIKVRLEQGRRVQEEKMYYGCNNPLQYM